MERCREAVGSFLGGIKCSTGFRVSEADFMGDRERSGVVLPPLEGRAAQHVVTSADLQGQGKAADTCQIPWSAMGQAILQEFQVRTGTSKTAHLN